MKILSNYIKLVILNLFGRKYLIFGDLINRIWYNNCLNINFITMIQIISTDPKYHDAALFRAICRPRIKPIALSILAGVCLVAAIALAGSFKAIPLSMVPKISIILGAAILSLLFLKYALRAYKTIPSPEYQANVAKAFSDLFSAGDRYPAPWKLKLFEKWGRYCGPVDMGEHITPLRFDGVWVGVPLLRFLTWIREEIRNHRFETIAENQRIKFETEEKRQDELANTNKPHIKTNLVKRDYLRFEEDEIKELDALIEQEKRADPKRSRIQSIHHLFAEWQQIITPPNARINQRPRKWKHFITQIQAIPEMTIWNIADLERLVRSCPNLRNFNVTRPFLDYFVYLRLLTKVGLVVNIRTEDSYYGQSESFDSFIDGLVPPLPKQPLPNQQ